MEITYFIKIKKQNWPCKNKEKWLTDFIFLSDFVAHINEISKKIPCREMSMKEILYILNTSENKRPILKYKRKSHKIYYFPFRQWYLQSGEFGNYVVEKNPAKVFMFTWSLSGRISWRI
jgi:hypothetical protein